ncbi:hypothetical protein MRY17_06500 [Pseudomonas orientalis]|uniref:dermonecrotic toxin domain-containing protein n=1 Tax=Pseudomonas orientalis TaxID=76758 RepID=UPI001FAFE735|nr:DUF6543 domain-containing protein [Pseudomonas orientalis]UOB25345.1 hypothetical protein MRY17_06500 [Pseudomonas orientalis]
MQPTYRLSSTPAASLTATQDNDYKTHYREQLQGIDTTLQFLRSRPTFSSFINERVNATFTSTANVDASRVFIKSDPSDVVVAQDAVQATRLLPSVMDAVIRRIVDKQPASFASCSTTFTFDRDEEADEHLPSSLTPAAFDTFLDELSASLQTAYRACLDAFWKQAVSTTDPRLPQDSVISARSKQISVEASLLRADGTLNTNGLRLVETFVAYPDALARQARPNRPAAYAVVLKGAGTGADMPLHGAVMLTAQDPFDSSSDRGKPLASLVARPVTTSVNVGIVVLFTPNRGLEAFPSLALLDKELHRRLNTDYEFDGLFSLLADKHYEPAATLRDKAQTTGCFDYKEILESVFSASVAAQYEKLVDDFAFMVSRYQRRGTDEDFSQLPVSLDRTTDMQKCFGVSEVLRARETKRSKVELEQFLSAASEADKQTWAIAARDYLGELERAYTGEGLPSVLQYGDQQALLAYSNKQLAQALEDQYGIDTDPSDIKVTVRRPNPAPGLYFPGARPNPQTGQSHYSIVTKSLAELALENVDYLDKVFVAKSRLSLYGEPYTALTTQQVKDLVREVDIGASYTEFLSKRLLTSPEAKQLKQSFANIMLKQLRVDIIEAKIAQDILTDSSHRGYALVNSALDQPTDTDERAKVDGYEVTVSALYITGAHVRGVLAFTSKVPKDYAIVLYTPRAKDGRAFREYTDTTQLREQFVNNPAWQDYLFERMDSTTFPRLRATLRRGILASEFSVGVIKHNFLKRAYDFEARAAIAQADRKTTSTHESNVRSTWTVIEGLVEVALAVFPVKVTFVIGLVRSAMALSAALDALQNQDKVGATHEFVRAFAYLVGALIDGAVGFTPMRLAPARPGLPNQMALSKAPQNVTPLAGWESQGIYTRAGKGSTPGQHFLKEKDQWFKVTYDETTTAGTWRLQNPRRDGRHQYHLPPIARNASNEWIIRSPEIGLRGGYHSRMARDDLMRLYPDLGDVQAARVLDSFEFPAGRERAMELRLVRRLGDGPLELQAIGLRDIPVEFRQYLNATTTLDQARLRLQGIDPGRTMPVALPAARASVIVTQQWKSWGTKIDPALLQYKRDTSQIWEYKPVYSQQSGWSQTEGNFIKVDDLYYPITENVSWYRHVVAIRKPGTAYGDFESFELMLRNSPGEQPMIATYDSGAQTWQVVERKPFEKTITAYVQDAFPDMTSVSHTQIARAVFNKYRQDYKYVDMLRVWRTGQTALDTPLSLLEPTRHTIGSNPRIPLGRAHEGTQPALWRRVDFASDRFEPHFNHAVTRPGPVTLRSLMTEVMAKVAHGELLEVSGTKLLFRRAGDDRFYCLHLVDTSEAFIADRGFRRFLQRPRDHRAVSSGQFELQYTSFRNTDFGTALHHQKVINLIGGLQHNRRSVQRPQLFIIRLAV